MNSPPATNTHERLTWAEICQRYPDEWVAVINIQRNDDIDADEVPIEYCTAVVIAHHETRKGISPLIKAAFERYDEIGSFWTGKLVAPPCCYGVP